MNRTLFFKLITIFLALISLTTGQSCPCIQNGSVLQCNVTGTSSPVNINSCNMNSYNSINVVYSGNVILNFTTSSTMPISIRPVDGSEDHKLQISAISSSASRIEIRIYLTMNQASVTLFTPTCSIIAPTSTLSINVIQTVADTNDFKIFDIPSSTIMTISNYELIFDTASVNSGTLNLPYLIRGLTSLTSITISGNNHILAVDSTQMSPSTAVNRLALKNLHLNDRILYNFMNLKEYSIEQCEYNQSARFFSSNQNYSISIEMKNNKPSGSNLLCNVDISEQLGNITSLTLIEPRFNSPCLTAIKKLPSNGKVYLSYGSYSTSGLEGFTNYKLIFSELTIANITDLSVFPPVYFNSFQALRKITLQGTFTLEKKHICIFLGTNLQKYPSGPNILLNSPGVNLNDQDNCALTYITAINTYTISNIECPPENSCEDCEEWANATDKCDLISFENACPVQPQKYSNIFTYNTSYLYLFFQTHAWLSNTTKYPSRKPEESINIGAIIGAVCGLIAAIIILIITIFCIRRHRQKDGMKYIPSAPQPDYKPSADDLTHVSIATSKTSQSSRYALEKSFFPQLQPTDEIAPPLYTSPSESVGSVSAYNLPSAPPAHRDSVSTHATHVYETVDS